MVSEYKWTQPVGGVTLCWKSLTVGQEMAIEMEHQRAETAPYRKYVVIQRRITAYGDKPVCTLEDLKSWDPIDLELFVEEIELREAERKAAFMRVQAESAPSPVVQLEAALMEMRSIAMQFLASADRALLAVKSVPPLEPAPR